MPRRRLWITGEKPLLGVCEYCRTQFCGGESQLGKSDLQAQFNAHKCGSPDARTTREQDARQPWRGDPDHRQLL
jgi:hypothetical protein